MKFLFILIAVWFSSTSLTTTDDKCEPYVPYHTGDKWELTNYDAKGKVESITSYEMVNVQEDAKGTKYTINASSTDKKGKELFSQEIGAWCKDGVFELDMSFLLNAAMMEAYKDMNVTIDNNAMSFPSFDSTAGTELPDAEITITIDMSGMGNMKMSIVTSDRKVDAKESITVPAGTYDCITITQTTTTKVGLEIKTTSKDSYAQGVGLVKSETFKKNGKLMGYTELTSLNKQ